MDKLATWRTLKNAGEVRGHGIASFAISKSHGYPPEIRYHRKCYQAFTLKRDLEKIKNEKETELEKHEDEKPLRSSVPVITSSPKSCMFCKKEKKYKDRKPEPLRQCVDTHDEILKSAILKNDFLMIGFVSKSGTKGYYHPSCYKKYVKIIYEQHDEKQEINGLRTLH